MRSIAACLILTAALSLLASAARVQAQDKILFDESHNQYYDSNKCDEFLAFIQSLGYVVEINDRPLTLDLLSQYKVVIITNPANDITMDEAEAIKSYVTSGGGLLITGDWTRHVNSESLNRVTEDFGITFNVDSYHDPTDNTGKPYYAIAVNIKPHAITEGVESLQYNGGTLTLSGSAVGVVLGDVDSFADEDGDHKAGPGEKAGEEIVLVAVAQPGKGRVVATGSSCMWRTKYGYFEHNQKFVENVIAWLAATGGPAPVYTLGNIDALGKVVLVTGQAANQLDARAGSLLSAVFNIKNAIKDNQFGTVQQDNVLVCGGPLANSASLEVNSLADVSFLIGSDYITLKVKGQSFKWMKADWKAVDYAVVFLAMQGGRYILAIEGCTRYGTYAGAYYLKDHYTELSGLHTIVIRWADADGNGEVSAGDSFQIVYQE